MVIRVDTSVTATLDQAEQLTPNAYFETGVTGWQGLNATMTQSSEQAHQGSFSMKVVPNGVSATAIGQTLQGGPSSPSVIPNRQYRFHYWMYSELAYANCEAVISWHNEDGTVSFGTTVGTTFAHPGAGWMEVELIATAPANAVRAQLRPRKSNTPAANQIFYIDEAILIPSSVPLLVTGRASIGPTRYGTTWRITRTSTTVINTEKDVALRVYRNDEQGSAVLDTTWSGRQDTSDTIIELGTLERLLFVWEGGDVSAIATATISGEQLGR